MATESRREKSESRLSVLSAEIESQLSDIVGDDARFCVYATGSYGRLEAWEESDADLFLLADPTSKTDLPEILKKRIVGRLIEAVEKAGFPEFDKDGKFLEVHNVSDMHRQLGSPEDDSLNAFTARMLLLLESRPVQNSVVYDELVQKIVLFYFQDHEDHAENFKPLFLLNDILRFWRTLTLNYESSRRGKLRYALDPETGSDQALSDAKAKSALKNYKLKFSRLTTCFSMAACLGLVPGPTDADSVVTFCAMTPADRLTHIGSLSNSQQTLVAKLIDRYEGFLQTTQRDKSIVLDEFRDPSKKQKLLKTATQYGDGFYELLRSGSDPQKIRYLII